jgi:hypothetical protein
LLDDVLDYLGAPIVVFSIVQWISSNGQSIGRTEYYAAVAANTVLLPASHFIVLSIIVIHIEGALVNTHLALDALFRVSFYNKL